MNHPRIGSMCSGYGGLEMGALEAFGGRVLWNADPDPHASAILAHNHPQTPNYGDIREVDWSAVPTVDILTAGFPCQPVSLAGKGRGTEDERWLFDDITDAISRMAERPRMLIFENVRGLLSANNGRAMARVVHGMAGIGYVGRYGVVRASDAGAPHQRARVFIIGTLPDSASIGRQWCRGTRNGRARPANVRHSVREWGDRTAAVRRWETVLGRPAPDPTEPNRNGRPALSAAFTEWLMGLPAGWVTDVPGLSRPQKIRALGNGVVPQQAALAISQLVHA